MVEQRETRRRARGVALPHLRAWRQARGLTMEALASASGVTHSALSSVEHGRKASGSLVVALAHALGITAEQLRDESPYREGI